VKKRAAANHEKGRERKFKNERLERLVGRNNLAPPSVLDKSTKKKKEATTTQASERKTTADATAVLGGKQW